VTYAVPTTVAPAGADPARGPAGAAFDTGPGARQRSEVTRD
jgi:hypothetical protein